MFANLVGGHSDNEKNPKYIQDPSILIPVNYMLLKSGFSPKFVYKYASNLSVYYTAQAFWYVTDMVLTLLNI